ncbi:hypothetical protein DRB06_02645 [Actinomyces sp. Z5]|uniref:hypothetical protein n=1 Tax=Actinomyces sp. Z5 TaxID=2250216 RepID=UPI000DCE09E1|nr:hypothetical protein [Actinomyces sp. Z5]RAX23377.1 hypothetical protein DRB06_02645 [Actinomyces sp. Z5]
MRRPSPFTYVFGGFFALLGAIFLTIGSRLLAFGVSVAPFAVAGVAGAAVLMIGGGLVPPLRFRTVFDAAGINSRGVLRTIHLPWPDSRVGFIVAIADVGKGGKRGPVALVEVGAAGHRVRLSAPRLSSQRAEDLRLRLEAEVDAIWAWALARGYARETMPALQGADPHLAQAAPPLVTAPRALPVDRTLLAREPLVLKDQPSWLDWCGLIPNTVILVLLCIVALPAVLGPERMPQAFAGVFREDGTLRRANDRRIAYLTSRGIM